MSSMLSRNKKRLKKKIRIAKKIKGTGDRPRLCVFRSAKHIYAQVIDDKKGVTIAQSSTLCDSMKNNSELTAKKVEATAVGKLIGERALYCK
jgi:large subunit ribosomal protein L18